MNWCKHNYDRELFLVDNNFVSYLECLEKLNKDAWQSKLHGKRLIKVQTSARAQRIIITLRTMWILFGRVKMGLCKRTQPQHSRVKRKVGGREGGTDGGTKDLKVDAYKWKE